MGAVSRDERVSRRRGGLAPFLLALLAGCEHAQPFGGASLGPNVPLSSSYPRQLTYGQGGDLGPAWLPDGSGIIYSFQRFDRPDHDRCLGILPPEGGQMLRTICHVPVVGDADSTNALWSPAVGPGGLLAYVRESSPVGALAPTSRELVVATLAQPDPGRVVLTFPHAAPDGTTEGTASYIQWIDGRTLIYLAEQVAYRPAPTPPDTIVTPIEIVRLTLAGDSTTLTVLPGTLGASSAALVGSDTVYFTLPRDSAVYATAVAGGPTTIVHDFGPLGAVADAQRQAGRLFVIAGQATGLGLGGWVYLLEPVGDTVVGLVPPPSVAGAYLWYKHAVASPSGARVAAEGHAVTIQQLDCPLPSCPVDTTYDPIAKLWLLKAP